MQARHLNRQLYFNEQAYTTQNFLIPFLQDLIPVTNNMKVAEVGCGEGGNLKPFLDMGCQATGIDISKEKINHAFHFFKGHPQIQNLTLINQDVYTVTSDAQLRFNLIILRDALEHIPNQDALLEHLKRFLLPGGHIVFAFAPWRMPFGGHQQMCQSRLLSHLPFFHLLPEFIYRGMLKTFGESTYRIDDLMEVKDTRISIQKFLRLIEQRNYTIVYQSYYLVNPNYEVKFKLKTRKLPTILNIPHVRDFFVTALYTVVTLNK
jgi:SAM-dependent methyltransferase